MIPVSIIIITKNEAENIEKCIQACNAIGDDIIVVDSGSTDGTVELAEKWGCRVFKEKWNGYGTNKNKGALYAKYDWILSLDADEVPDEELIASLHRVPLQDPAIAFDMKFRSFFGKKLIRYGNWGNDHRIRLFNRTYIEWSTARVHEKLLIPNFVSIKRLKGYINHYTVQSKEECDQKAMYYAGLSAEEYSMNHHRFYFKLYVSPTYGFIRNYIIRLGFLDGIEGWNIALSIYKNTWTKYAHLKHLQHKSELKSTTPQILKDLDMEYK